MNDDEQRDGSHGRDGRAPLRVLIAEDDEDLRRLLAQLLRLDGFRVTEALDGRVALASIAQAAASMEEGDRIDLILLDLAMPHHQGLDILRLIRRAHWRVPVIVMTASGPSVAQEALASGAVAVLAKPFDIDAFRLRVAQALKLESPQLSSSSTRTRAR